MASVGHNVEIPSRNRTVLVGLIRDANNPMSTRFEVRSSNPATNTYLALASIYQTMLDGIKAVVESHKTTKQLETDFLKEGEEKFYLQKTGRTEVRKMYLNIIQQRKGTGNSVCRRPRCGKILKISI